MIIGTVTCRIKPDFQEEFIERMHALAKVTRQEQGCLAYELHLVSEDHQTLFLYEAWESKRDLLRHINSEHMKAHLTQVQPWFDSIEMKTYQAEEFDLMGDASA